MNDKLQIPYSVCALLLEFAGKQKAAADSEATNQTEPATAQNAPSGEGTPTLYHKIAKRLIRPDSLPDKQLRGQE